MLWAVVFVVGGLALLAVAPDRFVAGAAGLADRLGVSRVLIGAVVIGFGTSMPELLVSGLATADGEPEVAVGNVVGSNIANLGLVLAVAALISRVRVPAGLLRREVPVTVVATVLFALLVQHGVTRVEGAVLAVAVVAALTILVRSARRPGDGAAGELGVEIEEYLGDETQRPAWRLAGEALVGLLGTLAGAQLLVTGAVEIASELDVSSGFVGVTIVAIGTSLPELVTAIAAARAGEDQLIIGNVLGSNMFNSLAVGAVVGLVRPLPVTDAALTVGGVAAMLVMTALGVLAMGARGSVTRVEATVLLVVYVLMLPFLAG
ncbi:MAG TPA: calcium/sodium antiporter [Acidimicrobiales bacterium]